METGSIRRYEDQYLVDVKKCISCGKDHDSAIVLVDDERVWYRCPKTTFKVFIREVRK